MKVKIKDIIFREDLYPRFDPNQEYIRKYAESIEFLPPIKIDQHNILIDGFHRLKAHELAKLEQIDAEIIEVKSEKELKRLAYKWNSIHGLQLEDDEKKRYANEMIGELSKEELAQILSISESTVYRWTTDKRKQLKEDRNREIISEYLRAWNTQESVAKLFNLKAKSTVNEIKKEFENSQIKKIEQDFLKKNEKGSYIKFQLYNIWNTPKGNKTEHFGSFPKIFMDNLLYYHTNIFDIIYDPFVGDGITIDSCKEFYRRYYCSDIEMKPGREKEMKERRIQDGYPEDLYQKPDLVFLDPPYWKQAEGKYTDSKDDLSNMELDQFYEVFQIFFNELIKRKVEKIAIVIQPTQFKNDFIFEDHIFEFNNMLRNNYRIEMRYILPYSTQQYNAQMVEKAKEVKKCLVLNRDLVIWRLK